MKAYPFLKTLNRSVKEAHLFHVDTSLKKRFVDI